MMLQLLVVYKKLIYIRHELILSNRIVDIIPLKWVQCNIEGQN